MYFKLALGNIKKSYKDYTIYFLTLILAVCIFYSFNSIDSQKALLDIKSSNGRFVTRLTEIISGLSVFVSVILGTLILYANNFLIKKRKKELGIYMTLGMGKRKISKILVMETSIVGIISLIAGLILGVGASQLLSAFALKLLFLSVAGTVLFFFSLSGVIAYIANINKKVYFKGLNIFVLKQINNKVNTNFLSMSIICLMLFTTMVILSTGIGYKKNYEAGLEKITPFDASLILYANDEMQNVEEVFDKIDFKLNKNEKYEIYNEYVASIKLNELFKSNDEELEGWGAGLVKLSDYNKILKLKDEKEIKLNKDEILILSNYNKLIMPINEKLKNSNKVNINGKEYLVKNHEAIEGNLNTYMMSDNYCTIVINDEFLSDCKVYRSVLNVRYLDENREEYNEKYDEIYNDRISGNYKGTNLSNIWAFSKDGVYYKQKGSTTSILFLAIYLGMVFLVTSMAVLAIQQLSEASDSIERYKALKRIGVNKKMINKTILIQTLIYFSLPVILALIHSIIAITVINQEINDYNQIDIRFSALITAVIFIVVYAGYFYTTYTGYKNIVKNNI